MSPARALNQGEKNSHSQLANRLTKSKLQKHQKWTSHPPWGEFVAANVFRAWKAKCISLHQMGPKWFFSVWLRPRTVDLCRTSRRWIAAGLELVQSTDEIQPCSALKRETEALAPGLSKCTHVREKLVRTRCWSCQAQLSSWFFVSWKLLNRLLFGVFQISALSLSHFLTVFCHV